MYEYTSYSTPSIPVLFTNDMGIHEPTYFCNCDHVDTHVCTRIWQQQEQRAKHPASQHPTLNVVHRVQSIYCCLHQPFSLRRCTPFLDTAVLLLAGYQYRVVPARYLVSYHTHLDTRDTLNEYRV